MSYRQKDQTKFSICTALISRGAPGSSSDKYAKDTTLLGITRVNSNDYKADDIVGVSVNGNRAGRLHFDKQLISKALQVGATIVKDSAYHTNRYFNIGERELQTFLLEQGATCTEDTVLRSYWKIP
jgi:3-dehydroquinate synthase class II